MSNRRAGVGRTDWPGWALLIAVSLAHTAAIWVAMGGRDGLANEWPLWRDDHPLYFHSALVTRAFLRQTGTTAGYDPSFMSGYAKSVVWPTSSTLPELVLAMFGGNRPELAYKLYVFFAAVSVPWLTALAGLVCRLRPGAVVLSVVLFLVYIWTDFPINYAGFGMLPYFVAIPFGLVALSVFCRYLERGGFGLWLASAIAMALAVLIHLTSALVLAPAAAAAYAAALWNREPDAKPPIWRRHLGVWSIPVVVLALNAFWWLPGLWLASTKGPSDFAFVHPEGVLQRLAKIESSESPIESVLLGTGLLGFVVLVRRCRVTGIGLGVFAASGFFWGYLSGGARALDFLQPGRHTYAFYSALALASGAGLSELGDRLRNGASYRLDRWAAVGLILVAWRVFGGYFEHGVLPRLKGPYPFLASRPPPRLLWIVARVQQHMKPGERLLYEEGGFGIEGVPDPFYPGGRFSGLLPWKTGVELIGGPYLHASLTTNFTQFGEGRLFGETNWGRAHFTRFARLYRPAAIVCWTPHARAFCQANPDLVKVVDDDGKLLFGRVLGFEGGAISGTATVEATPGRLRVTGVAPGLDGKVVLRYHSVPCLRIYPPVDWAPVLLDGDPVPFIGLSGDPGTVTLEIRFPPGGRVGRAEPEARAE
jgi:hypothetical protein